MNSKPNPALRAKRCGSGVKQALCRCPTIRHQHADQTHKSLGWHMPDGSFITALVTSSDGLVKAVGTAAFLCEVGVIFGWLCAAFRTCPTEGQISSGTPQINKVIELHSKVLCFEMSGVIGMAWRKEDSKPGQCWHSLFGNPIVVEGYPMSQRPKGNTGIEIPLHMAAAFIAAPRLHRFLRHYYLKGFSAILIAVEVVGNVVLWHHWYNPTGERISYLDAATAEGKIEISLEDLRSRRHVGWCSEALCMAGKYIRLSGTGPLLTCFFSRRQKC